MSMFRRGLMLAASQTKKENPIYGVKWVNDATTTMTRTDDSTWFSYKRNSDGSISSDFNDVFPWNEAKRETLDAGEFLHMPDMYFRIGVDEDGNINSVAVSNKMHEVGDWYKVDSFYCGLYGASENADKLASLPKKDWLTNITLNDLRTKSKATGSNYFQLGLYHKTVMTFLWWIEWATKNSENIMTGAEINIGSYPRQTGGTDQISTPSGFNTITKQMRYHYIEDFVGNCDEFIDGVRGASTPRRVLGSSNHSDYADVKKYNILAYDIGDSGDFIVAFGWDAKNPFLCYYSKKFSEDYPIGFCDVGWMVNSNYPVLYSDYGPGGFVCLKKTNTLTTIGGRLLYIEPTQ